MYTTINQFIHAICDVLEDLSLPPEHRLTKLITTIVKIRLRFDKRKYGPNKEITRKITDKISDIVDQYVDRVLNAPFILIDISAYLLDFVCELEDYFL